MSLNASELSRDILSSFKSTFSKKWPEIKEYGEAEATKLARTMVMIEALKAAGKITDEQALLHLQIQQNATRMVFLTLEGLGILAVEAAIRAALDVVKGTVNSAIGIALL